MAELYHYGVKGMKWGVRKKDVSTYNRSRRMALEKAKTFDATKPNDGRYYDESFNHDRVLKKGSMVYRFSSVDKEVNRGRTYAFFTQNDYTEYADSAEGLVRSNGNLADKLHAYKVKKDMRIPSTKVMFETYVDMVFLDKAKTKTFAKAEVTRMGKKQLMSWVDENGKLTLEQATNKMYKQLIDNDSYNSFSRFISNALRGSSHNIGTNGEEFISRLKEKGYDAIPDLNDNLGTMHNPSGMLDGHPSRYENPIFIFDRQETLTAFNNKDHSDTRFEERYNLINEN